MADTKWEHVGAALDHTVEMVRRVSEKIENHEEIERGLDARISALAETVGKIGRKVDDALEAIKKDRQEIDELRVNIPDRRMNIPPDENAIMAQVVDILRRRIKEDS